MEKTRVIYEFRKLSGSQTLVLDRPAEITFQLFQVGEFATINNSYRIQSRQDSLSPVGLFDWQLSLKNNVNEVDVTQYVINMSSITGILNCIIKYYEKY